MVIISFPNIVFSLEITLDGDYFIFQCRLHTKITLDGVTPGVGLDYFSIFHTPTSQIHSNFTIRYSFVIREQWSSNIRYSFDQKIGRIPCSDPEGQGPRRNGIQTETVTSYPK